MSTRLTAKEICDRYIDELEQGECERDIDITLPVGQPAYEYVIISDLNLGARDNRPAIKKLVNQIKWVEQNDTALVVLGGNLLAYTREPSAYKKYIDVVTALLSPIKDKIILAYGASEDKKYAKAKDALYPNKTIIKKLHLNPSKIVRDKGGVVNVTVTSKHTDDQPVVVKDRFVSIKSTAQTFSAEGNNGYKSVGNAGNFDNIFVTCANNSGVFRKAIMRQSSQKNNDQIEKHSYNLVLDSGYKLFMKTPSNRIVRYNFTDKYSYKITPSVNKDCERVVGKDTLTEEPYKAYISRCVIGREKVCSKIASLTNAYIAQKNANELKAKWLIEEIRKKLNAVNEQNLANLIEAKNRLEARAEKNTTKEPTK